MAEHGAVLTLHHRLSVVEGERAYAADIRARITKRSLCNTRTRFCRAVAVAVVVVMVVRVLWIDVQNEGTHVVLRVVDRRTSVEGRGFEGEVAVGLRSRLVRDVAWVIGHGSGTGCGCAGAWARTGGGGEWVGLDGLVWEKVRRGCGWRW